MRPKTQAKAYEFMPRMASNFGATAHRFHLTEMHFQFSVAGFVLNSIPSLWKHPSPLYGRSSLALAILGRRCCKVLAEEFRQPSTTTDSASARDLVDRQIGFSKKAAAHVEPHVQKII